MILYSVVVLCIFSIAVGINYGTAAQTMTV